MRRFFLAILFGCVFLNACQPREESPTPTVMPTLLPQGDDTRETVIEDSINFTRHGLDVGLPRPKGWESFDTADGVVVAEKFGTVANRGELHGLMIYVFVTPLSLFPPPSDPAPDANRAAQALVTAASDSQSAGGAHTSPVVGFDWAGRDAAYYTYTEPAADLYTFVIGVVLPDHGLLLTSTFSAPHAASRRIRPLVPRVLAALILDAQPLGGEGLDALPQALDFPR